MRRSRRRRRQARAFHPRLVAAEHHHPCRQGPHLLEGLGHSRVGRRAVDVDVEPVGPGRGALRPGLQRHQVHAPDAEGLERERQHAGLVVDQHDEGGLAPAHPGASIRERGRVGPGERQEPGLVGGIVLDPLREGHQAVAVGGVARRDGGERRITLLGHQLGAAGRVPGAHQLDVRQVFRQPDPALTQRHRMAQHPLDAVEPRPGHRHDRVMHRIQDLVRQP